MRMKPALFNWGKSFNRKTILTDITAGISVGIIAIPLSIALAIASGSTPETGLWTSALAGLTAAFLAGCPQQISGPSATLVVISYSTIALYGFGGLLAATFMAGIFLILFGLLNLGKIIQYMPYPIVVGFTAGVAFVLAVGQLGDFMGLQLHNPPADVPGRLSAYLQSIHSFNPYALVVGVLSVVVIVAWNRFVKRIPGYLIAILFATVLSRVTAWPIETIGSRFGQVSSALPSIHLPALGLDNLRLLLLPAFTIAFIVSLESLLSAVVADNATGDPQNPNMELIAQGSSNLVSALIGGLPSTGVIARTAANVKSGAKSPVSGLVHSGIVILCNLLLMPYLSMVPMAALAGVLAIVCYNMVEWKSIIRLLKTPRTDILIMLATFCLTVLLDLSTAIISSVLLASLIFTTRMSRTSKLQALHGHRHKSNPALIAYEIEGPLFFGFAHKIKKLEEELAADVQQVNLDFNKVHLIDATGLNALDRFIQTGQSLSINIFFLNVRPHVRDAMEKAGILSNVCME